MTNIPPSELIYGYLGTPLYDIEEKILVFPRQHVAELRLRPFGLVRHGSHSYPASGHTGHHLVSRDSNPGPSSYPEISGACGAIDAVLDDSNHVSHEAEPFPFFSGERLVYTTISDQTKQRSSKQEPLLVTVAGNDGELLRLSLLIQQNVAWYQHAPAEFRQTTSIGSETGWWTSAAEPIQQICASRKPSEDHSFSLLAVRCASNISILAPFLLPGKATPETGKNHGFSLEASRLQANEIVKIEWQTFCKAPFRDVAFSHWEITRFATIDAMGYWLVWEMQLLRTERHAWKARVSTDGRMGTDSGNGRWAMIAWVCDSETLVLARRKSLLVQDLLVLSNVANCTNLILKDASEMFLDVKCPSNRTQHLFILTTRKISILSVKKIHEESAHCSTISVTLLLSWIHYRDPRDLSLNLTWSHTFLVGNDADIDLVLLSSRMPGPVTVFTFRHQTSNLKCISVVDPYDLQFLPDVSASSAHEPIRQISCFKIHFRPLPPAASTRASRSGQDGQHDWEGYGFFQLTALLDNYAIIEGLYCITPEQITLDRLEPHISESLDYPVALLDVQDDFVDYDDLVATQQLQQWSVTQGRSKSSKNPPDTDAADVDPKTLNLESLAEALNRSSVDRIMRRIASRNTTIDLISKMQAALYAVYQSHEVHCLTFYEILDGHAGLLPPDMTDDDINRIFRAADQELGTSVRQMTGRSLALLSGSSELSTLREVSSSLRELLPQAMDQSEYTKTREEGRVRMAAINVYLSSYAVSLPVLTESVGGNSNQSQSQQSPSKNAGRSPLLGSSTPGPSQTQLSSLASSPRRSIGQSSQRSAPSPRSSAPSQPMSSQELSEDEDEASHRLGTLTSLKSQPPLPPLFSKMLNSWNIGDDPDAVDWEATTQSLLSINTADEDTEAIDAQKKRRKRQKRPRESADNWSAKQPLQPRPLVIGSQPLPLRGSGSQPVPDTGENTGTQVSDRPFVSTQPEVGPHGRRQKGKIAVKKKRPGF